MKNLKLSIAILIISFLNINGKEYKTAINQSTKINIENLMGEITIEGSNSAELMIKVDKYSIAKLPKRAKGLKSLSYGGTPDNTKIGLNVTTKNGVMTISGASKQSSDAKYTFYVPKGVNVKIEYRSPFAHEDIFVNNFSNEIDITTLTASTFMKNVSGPIILNSTSGDVDIKFGKVNQKSPISITAISGEVDIALPTDTKARMNMRVITGEIFTDFDLKFKKGKKLNRIGGQKIECDLNGGGVDITLKAISGNIYLRKGK